MNGKACFISWKLIDEQIFSYGGNGIKSFSEDKRGTVFKCQSMEALVSNWNNDKSLKKNYSVSNE